MVELNPLNLCVMKYTQASLQSYLHPLMGHSSSKIGYIHVYNIDVNGLDVHMSHVLWEGLLGSFDATTFSKIACERLILLHVIFTCKQ